jgi:hypothetical protein
MKHYTNTNSPIDFPVDMMSDKGYEVASERDTIIQECIDAIRKEWYTENNIDTNEFDARQIGLHVGTKGGLTTAMNAVAALRKMNK